MHNILRRTAVFCLLILAGQMPAQAQPNGRPAALATVPIDITDNRVHAAFEINGHTVHMLLDTGASTSLLFESNDLKASDFELGRLVEISFPAFAASASGAKIQHLELKAGDFALTSDTTLFIQANEAIIGDIGAKFSGILGRDFFENYVVEVIPSESVMKLYRKGTDLAIFYRLRHPLIMEDGTPYLAHRSRLPWEPWPTVKKLLLDTGYPGGVVLWKDRHFNHATEPAERDQFRAEHKGVVYFGIVRFGKLLFRNIPVFIGPTAPGQLEDRDGLIGASMFLPFRYVIDLGAEQLLLEPRVKSAGIGYQISNEVIYTPGNEDFVMKDFRPKPSSVPTAVYNRTNTEVVPD